MTSYQKFRGTLYKKLNPKSRKYLRSPSSRISSTTATWWTNLERISRLKLIKSRTKVRSIMPGRSIWWTTSLKFLRRVTINKKARSRLARRLSTPMGLKMTCEQPLSLGIIAAKSMASYWRTRRHGHAPRKIWLKTAVRSNGRALLKSGRTFVRRGWS